MKRVFSFGLLATLAVVVAGILSHTSFAAEPASGFSLQVTPSPLVATVKPGETTTLDLKIRNTGTSSEKLVVQPRSFRIDNSTGEIKLEETKLPEIKDWLSFSQPSLSLKPGEIATEKVSIAVPKDAGFSYSFILLVRRAETIADPTAGRQLEGSVAIFTLLNVDRPGATRKIELTDVSTTQQIYEFLPVTIKLRFKNTGNTIAQPYGNIFVQRESTDEKPISTLPVNDKRGYILPGTERVLDVDWKDGFAVYQTITDASGKQVKTLERNPNKLADFRIGKYTAKIVAVYNNGQRDVPIEKTITFWVIPWRAIGVLLLVLTGIFFLVRFFVKRKTDKAVKKALEARERERS
jgi:hypothetical protein